MATAWQPSTDIQLGAVHVGRPPAVLGRLGTWELVRLAGQGQLATVHEARPVTAEAERPASYAVKSLRGEWQDDPRGRAMLCREVQVGRAVRSRHLVPIVAAELRTAPLYVVMPLLQGRTLAAHLSAQKSVDLSGVFWIGRQVAEALAALDAAGWRHADIKPSNIFVAPNGHATLIDLGFARAHDECTQLASRPLVGTLNYVAPEILYSALAGDIQSDVYSLGVTLFEVLTGHLPFDATSVAGLTEQHRHEMPANLRGLVPHVPTRAARLVHRMLAKEPLRRPTPQELIDRFAALEIETFAERAAG